MFTDTFLKIFDFIRYKKNNPRYVRKLYTQSILTITMADKEILSIKTMFKDFILIRQ